MSKTVYVPYVLGRSGRPITYQYENVATRLDETQYEVTCFTRPGAEPITAGHVDQIALPESADMRRRGRMLAASLRTYDVLQTGGGPKLRYFLSLGARLRNDELTHVHTLHIDVEGNVDRRGYKSRLVSIADTVTAVSEHTAETAAREFGVSPEVIYNAINTDFFRPDRRPPALLDRLNVDSPVFLYVGRLVPWKRPLDVVEVARRIPDASFLIRGTGPLRESVQEATGDLDNLYLLEKLEKSVLADLYANVTALLFPSVREGCPTVVLEALASATPVVGYRATSMPELIADGETGFLREPGAVDELATAVAQVTEGDRRAEFGARGREYVTRNHRFAQTAEQYQSLYR